MKIYFKNEFISVIRNAKEGRKELAKNDLYELRGANRYAYCKKDISKDTYKRIYKLTKILIKKYDLY